MRKKKFLKNFLVFIVSVLIFSGAVKMFHAYLTASRKDEVVLRFAVTTGTYIYDESDSSLTNFINKVYSYADTQKENNVDAIIVNGNLTGDGSADAFNAVDEAIAEYLREDTKFYFTTGEDDFSMENEENVKTNILSNSSDFVVKIKGYNFIFWAPIYNSYATKFQWVDSTLAELTCYNASPVFVFQYASLKDTFYGSDNWYTYESEQIMQIMEKYPTVVNFSSSTSTPANLVTSVYQNKATYINTGALSRMKMNYNQFGLDTSSNVTGAHINNASQCRIVEVYGDGRVDVKTMDVNTGKIYTNVYDDCEMLCCFYPGRMETYNYTSVKNQPQDEPCFTQETQITLKKNEKSGTDIVFSEAYDKDGVLLYAITFFDEDNNEMYSRNIYSNIALYDNQDYIEFNFKDFEAENVRSVEIVPYDVCGVMGEAIYRELEN